MLGFGLKKCSGFVPGFSVQVSGVRRQYEDPWGHGAWNETSQYVKVSVNMALYKARSGH
jgi:hypothetical protein